VSRTTRTIRTDLPVEVWDRLAEEAAAKGIPLGRLLRQLIVARDKRKHGDS
jgi:macrodomain Ter protein organizer (MatP/YcbG family)